MAGRSLGCLAATAAFALLGGLHLEIAAGRSIDRLAPDGARALNGSTIAATGINRSAKRARGQVSPRTADGRTITFQHPDLPSTTVAVHIRETAGATKGRPALKERDRRAPAGKPRQTVACESVVSLLTEVAKQLEAGRCVT